MDIEIDHARKKAAIEVPQAVWDRMQKYVRKDGTIRLKDFVKAVAGH